MFAKNFFSMDVWLAIALLFILPHLKSKCNLALKIGFIF